MIIKKNKDKYYRPTSNFRLWLVSHSYWYKVYLKRGCLIPVVLWLISNCTNTVQVVYRHKSEISQLYNKDSCNKYTYKSNALVSKLSHIHSSRSHRHLNLTRNLFSCSRKSRKTEHTIILFGKFNFQDLYLTILIFHL